MKYNHGPYGVSFHLKRMSKKKMEELEICSHHILLDNEIDYRRYRRGSYRCEVCGVKVRGLEVVWKIKDALIESMMKSQEEICRNFGVL